jgi:serine/threonine protein phosphatase PrpC
MIKAAKYNKNLGSSTMSVVTIDGKLLRTCHIGGIKLNYTDCTLVVFRKYSSELISIYESVEQQHSFNYPFQLAIDKNGGDDPSNAICASLELKQGDILVLGSDGIFDNIYVHEVK